MKKLFILFFLLFMSCEPVAAQKVHEVCQCHFPAQVGGYKNFEATNVRHVVWHIIPGRPFIVREILAERRGDIYRFISLVVSTEKNTVGRVGPVIEIVEWNGDYWPGEVIYQLTLKEIAIEYIKLTYGRK